MSGDRLNVKTSVLRSAAGEFVRTSGQIKSLTAGMTSTVNSLGWTGDAATAYINKFQGLRDEIEKIDQMINAHVNHLNEIAAEYDRVEAQNQQTAQSLKTDLF